MCSSTPRSPVSVPQRMTHRHQSLPLHHLAAHWWSSSDVVAAVRQLPDKQCASDPLPTSLLKENVDVLALFLTELFRPEAGRPSAARLFEWSWPSTRRAVRLSCSPLDVNSCTEGSGRHSPCSGQWRSCYPSTTRLVRCIRYRRPCDIAAATADFVRSRRPCTRLVPVLSQRPISVCPLWRKLVDSTSADMWSPTRIGPWTDFITVIHGRSASTNSCLWFETPPLCWWHSDLRFLPPRILSGTSEPYHRLYQRCSCVDEIQSTATECWQNRDHLVYIITSPTSDTNCLVRYWRWCHHICLISARPGNLSGLRLVNANAHFEDCVSLFCSPPSDLKYPSVCH